MHFGTLVRLSVVALLAGLLPVLTTAPAHATVPFGDVNVVESLDPGRIHVQGWAIDGDEPGAFMTIKIMVGSQVFDLGEANVSRPDVGDAYPAAGDYHGFDTVIDVPLIGDQSWVLAATDRQGETQLIESGRVTIADPSPTGAIESRSSTVNRTLDIAGWASDPNAPSTPTAVGVYVGGPVGTPGVEVTRVPANLTRSDGRQGFSARISTAKTGTQQVYVYAANVPGTPGNDALIGKTEVTIFVDSTAPQTTITSAPTVATPQDVIRVTYSASEPNSTFQCRWDSAAWSSCPGTSSISLPPGQHTFEVRATDAAGNTDPTPASAVVVVSNYVTQPLPGADRKVKVGAVKKKSKLRINVDPDSAADNYRVTIQRKVGKRWRNVQRARTRGDLDVVVVDLRRGKYRVVLPAQDLSPAITSGAVRLKR